MELEDRLLQSILFYLVRPDYSYNLEKRMHKPEYSLTTEDKDYINELKNYKAENNEYIRKYHLFSKDIKSGEDLDMVNLVWSTYYHIALNDNTGCKAISKEIEVEKKKLFGKKIVIEKVIWANRTYIDLRKKLDKILGDTFGLNDLKEEEFGYVNPFHITEKHAFGDKWETIEPQPEYVSLSLLFWKDLRGSGDWKNKEKNRRKIEMEENDWNCFNGLTKSESKKIVTYLRDNFGMQIDLPSIGCKYGYSREEIVGW